MALKVSPRGGHLLRSSHPSQFEIMIGCETNNTDAPDGSTVTTTVGAWTRSGVGTLVFTFTPSYKPLSVEAVHPFIWETDTDLDVVYNGDYSATTGAMSFTTRQKGGAAQSATLKMYQLGLQATLANGADPSSSDPATDTVWARTGEGVYTVTWSAGTKPLEVTTCIPKIVAATSVQRIEFVSYDYSTGVMTLNTFGVDLNTADDCAGKVVHVHLLCTDTALAATTAAQKAAQGITAAAADTTDKTLRVAITGSRSGVNA